MKSLTLIFYGKDGDLAKLEAAAIRKVKAMAQIRHAAAFGGEVEQCERVLVLADVSDIDRKRIAAAYGDKIGEAGSPPPPPPPPPPLPPPVDALENLPEDWRETFDPLSLRELAARVSGRAVENREQAIDVIADELGKRQSQ